MLTRLVKKVGDERKTAVPMGPAVADALGQSEAFLDFQERLSAVAKVNRPVLIVGERGTGKELAASRVHYLSSRWQGPWVALNCAALSTTLIESELFGHEAGAFTGAVGRRAGRFETADGGSLFLDEIGLVPLEVQEKILRVVEYQSFERVGGSQALQVDVRVVAATNACLPELARQGRFKQDLLDRLSFEVLHLPPLRERAGDIMLLARHFGARMAAELGHLSPPEFTERAARELEAYAWPGNVRELKNVVERTVFRTGGGVVDAVDFDPFRPPLAAGLSGRVPAGGAAEESAILASGKNGEGAREGARTPGRMSLAEAMRELELDAIRRALREARYRQAHAARLMGLTYHQFRRLYRKHQTTLAAVEKAAGKVSEPLRLTGADGFYRKDGV